MISDRAFICHMCIPCGKTFSLLLRSRSSSRSMANIKVTLFKRRNGLNKDIKVSQTQHLDGSKLEAFVDISLFVAEMHRYVLESVENITEKEDNKHFLLFP